MDAKVVLQRIILVVSLAGFVFLFWHEFDMKAEIATYGLYACWAVCFLSLLYGIKPIVMQRFLELRAAWLADEAERHAVVACALMIGISIVGVHFMGFV